jgi:hypothetical protein
VFWLSVQFLSETFLIFRIIQRGIIINGKNLHLNYKLLLSDFNEAWIFSTDFRKMLKHHISRKSLQWVQSCSRGRAGMTKLIVAFRKFAYAQIKGKKLMIFWTSREVPGKRMQRRVPKWEADWAGKKGRPKEGSMCGWMSGVRPSMTNRGLTKGGS